MGDQQKQSAYPYAADDPRHTFEAGRIGAWAALLGSVFYLSVFTLEGWLRPDYDAASMFVSELSLGPWGWVQIVNFMIFGVSLLVFAIGVAMEFGGSARSARIGATLIAIMGISMLASGPFVIDPVVGVGAVAIDPSAITPHQMSFHSKFHYALGTTFFFLAPVVCLCFIGFKRSSKDPGLRAFRLWSLGLGLVSLGAVILFRLALLPPAASNPLLPWRGFIQRASVIAFLVWMFIFALMMLKHSRLARSLVGRGGATISALPQSSPQSAASDVT